MSTYKTPQGITYELMWQIAQPPKRLMFLIKTDEGEYGSFMVPTEHDDTTFEEIVDLANDVIDDWLGAPTLEFEINLN